MCREPKRTVLFEYLSRIYYTKLEITGEVLGGANQMIDMDILTPKSIDDCQHIATAVVHGCDCILSWNFKHIGNQPGFYN